VIEKKWPRVILAEGVAFSGSLQASTEADDSLFLIFPVFAPLRTASAPPFSPP